MQVQSVQSNYYNNNQKQNPNFTSIKKIGYSGLYEKAPEEGQKLLEAFKQNRYAMDFCSVHDVKIFFHAMKEGYNRVESSIHIFYDNPTVGKIRKFFRALCNNEEQVKIHSWQTNLEESTNELAEMILPYEKGHSKSGLLNSHIEIAYQSMQKVRDAKEAKKLAKLAKKQEKLDAKNQYTDAKQRLDKSINDLIESSN